MDVPPRRARKCLSRQRWRGFAAPVCLQTAAGCPVLQTDHLRFPPSNRLELLRGDRAGRWSLRINDQWRLCFRFEGRDAFDVEIVDYH
jgi:hypothetical protein